MQKIMIKSSDWGGYDIIKQGLTPGGKRYNEKIFISVRSVNKAIDLARLYFYTDESIKSEYKIPKEAREKIDSIACKVENEYCSWAGFVENVIESDQGLQGLIDMILEGKSTREIVNNYI